MKYVIKNDKGQYLNNQYYRGSNRLTNNLSEAHKFTKFEMLLSMNHIFKDQEVTVIPLTKVLPALANDILNMIEGD